MLTMLTICLMLVMTLGTIKPVFNNQALFGKMAAKISLGPLESDFHLLGIEEMDSSHSAKIRHGFLPDDTTRPTQPKNTYRTGFLDLLPVLSDFQVV